MLEHGEALFGFVLGDGMACSEDLEEGEVVIGLELSSSFAVEFPVLSLSLVKLALSAPFKSIGPGLTSHPVANEVLVSVENEDFDTGIENSW